MKIKTVQDMARAGGRARWAGSTKEERRAFAMQGVLARGDKLRVTKTTGRPGRRKNEGKTR